MEITKGEWTNIDFKDSLDLFERGHFQVVGDNQRENVAIIPAHWKNAEANAQLISSAPDLYEALEEALITLTVLQGEDSAVIREIKRALAKARSK